MLLLLRLLLVLCRHEVVDLPAGVWRPALVPCGDGMSTGEAETVSRACAACSCAQQLRISSLVEVFFNRRSVVSHALYNDSISRFVPVLPRQPPSLQTEDDLESSSIDDRFPNACCCGRGVDSDRLTFAIRPVSLRLELMLDASCAPVRD